MPTSHRSTPVPPATARMLAVGAEVDSVRGRRLQRRGRRGARSRCPRPAPRSASRSPAACPSRLNAAPLTGASKPWSQARIREPCSSAPSSAPRESTESCRRSASSASSSAEVRVLLGGLARLGGQPPRLRHGRGVPRAAALVSANAPATSAADERGRDAREQRAQAASPPLRGASARAPARRGSPRRKSRSTPERLARVGGQLAAPPGAARGRGRHRHVPPRPTTRGRGRQLPAGAELLAVLRQPSPQPRPLADQRLVRDLGRRRRRRRGAARPASRSSTPAPPSAPAPRAAPASACPRSRRRAR